MVVRPATLALYEDLSPRAVVGGERLYTRFVKPSIDVLAATVLLVLALPLMILVALAVRLTMGAGVIYKQQRVGRNGSPFTIYKFRTMLADRRTSDRPYDGPDRRVSHKRADDPRHTPVGRFLRKTSLDELPQLWNVLRQDMSLVGPRPELVGVVAKYQAWQHQRHLVRPGITGLWQVSKRGGALMCEDSTADLDYVRSVSLVTDLSVLVRTVPAVLRGTGS